MLLQFRKFSRGAIATGILILIGVAMVLFLPSGQFTLTGASDIANVKGYAVTPRQLSRELQLTLRAERNREGGSNLSQQDAIDAGLHTRLLEGMLSRLSFYAYADRLGVSASDRQVGERIRQIPNVSNPITGQFDRSAYATFLRELGYNQTEFERDVRGDLTNQMLLEALVTGVRPPSSYGALALVFETETRVVSIAEAPISVVGNVPPPTEEQIEAFYNENRDAMRVPEYRGITLVLARPQDFVSRVQVPAEEIERELQQQLQQQRQPERRTFVRIVAQSEAQANELVQRIGRGEAPTAAAQALRLQATRGENQTREEVADRAVAEAVFSMAAGGPARVVRGQLSPFVVVRVESITAAPPVDAEALRNQIREQIALEEAGELLNAAIAAFEEARDAGTPAAAAAAANGLPALTVPAVDARGRDQQGQPIPALAPFAEQIAAAFEIPEGETSDFIPADGADLIVGVDRIIPASVRPLADVREELTAAWINRERVQRLRALGQEVVAAVEGGQDFAAAARARRMNVVLRSQQMTREAASRNIPSRGLPPQIFNAAEGDVIADLTINGQGLLVARVERIQRVNPSERPQEVEASRVSVEGALSRSLAEAVQGDVRAAMRARVNQRALEQNFRPSAGADAEEE